jgi:hypothetical protein
MPDLPWTIEGARDALRRSSSAQLHAEQGLREAAKGQAEAEQSYRVSLAKAIVELRADGTAATVCADLARGDKTVAALRYTRDVAEGVREAAVQAAWRAAADRRDVQSLARWSQARDLAEGHGDTPEPEHVQTFGRRAA